MFTFIIFMFGIVSFTIYAICRNVMVEDKMKCVEPYGEGTFMLNGKLIDYEERYFYLNEM